MPSIGLTEMVVVIGIVALLFGAKRLPEAARGLGKSLNAFKEGLSGAADDKRA